MSIGLITLAALVVAAVLALTAIRTWQGERTLLYGLVPLLLAFGLGTGVAIQHMLGYATGDLSDLRQEFVYLHHAGSDPVYLLAVPAGGSEPRLYAVPGDMLDAASRQSLSAAQERAKQGVPQMGVFAEGMQLHDIDVRALMPKEG